MSRWRCLLAGLVFVALLPRDALPQEAAWRSHMETAAAAHRRGDSANSERSLRGALELAQGFARHDRRRGETHMALATVLFEQERYAEARSHLERTVAIFETAPGGDHALVATALDALALTHMREGGYAEAEPAFGRALAIFETEYGPDHGDVGQVLGNLAGLYLADGRYQGAEPLYRRSIAIKEKTFGGRHSEVGQALASFAIVLRMIGREAEADAVDAGARAILYRETKATPAG